KGSLSQHALSNLEKGTQNSDTRYRWVHKDVKDSQGRPLSETLVQVHDIDAQHPAFENPSDASFLQGPKGTQLAFNDGAYDAIDPKTGEKFSGEVDKKTSKAIFNDSDYKWGDITDRGHKLLGRVDGQPLY